VAPFGFCPPKPSGMATININPIPVITNAPASASFCYLYGFDLSSLEPSITTLPSTTNFVWYDSAVGGSPIFPYVNPSVTTTYYVAATTGLPANCEETTRTPVILNIQPLPDIPAMTSNGITATFYPMTPDCMPFPCSSGLEYSVNGVNWGAGPSFTATDPGWAGFGSPTNSLVYIRNTASPACFTYATYFGSLIPLPTTLFHFYGKSKEDRSINLFWQTAQEKNVSHFEIEKSADKTAFAKIGEIKAIGNTSDISDYTFNDASPYNGSNYYRLKITDIDGQFAYSNVIMLQSDGNATTLSALYPNPARESLTLDMNASKEEKGLIEIIDALGKRVLGTPVFLQKGYNQTNLQIERLAKGHYTLRILTSGVSITRNFVKE
jgi:hypothetical protein